MTKRYCIYGAGGHARDLLALIAAENAPDAVACLVDDFHPGRILLGIEVVTFAEATERFPDCQWLVAIGSSSHRERISGLLAGHSLEEGRFISSRAYIAADAMLSPGVQVFAGCCVSANAMLGRGVILNFNCTVSHDTSLGDFVTVSPGCTIAGRVVVGRSAFIGAGATVINGAPGDPLTVGASAVIGAGAVATRDVPEGDVVAGVPARSIRKSRP
jgi:sugar O-acyltransferase (sialic acid O-acetyltransferase NeuD family)